MESKFKLQALNFNVIVREIENKVLKEGIDLTSAEDKNQKFKRGFIQAVGISCPNTPEGKPILKVGDEIIYDSYKASPLTLEGEIYQVIYFADVTGIL